MGSRVYVVVSRAGDLPICSVSREEKKFLRTLHRDLLLPCGFLPVSFPERPAPPLLMRRPRINQNPGSENEEDGVNKQIMMNLIP